VSRPASFEAAVHEGLHGQGFPVPRVLAARDGSPSFLLMERLPGRSLADGVEFGPDVRSRLMGMAAMTRLSLGLPERLGEVTGRLLALDPEPVVDALAARGLPAEAIGFGRHLTNLSDRVARTGLNGFEAGVHWLREARPAEPERRAICHGDLAPNLLLEGGRVTGVIDWSPLFATVTDPAFEIANSRIMIQVPLPLPAGLLPLSRSYQRHLTRRYARALGPRWAPPAERLRYYEAWRCLLAVLGAAELWRARAAGAPPPARPDPWHLPLVAIRVAAAFRERTGVAIELPEPPD
jgi:aminoglycoside phosphotransferase (APT) family kinase protein